MESAVRNDMTENRKPSVLKRFLVLLLVTLLLFAGGGYGGLYVLLKGPSVRAGDRLIAVVADHAVGNAVVHLFLTSEEIEQRLETAQDESGEEKQFSVYPQLG